MSSDIILNDNAIRMEGSSFTMVGGSLIVNNDQSTGRVSPDQAIFNGPEDTRVVIRSGAISITGEPHPQRPGMPRPALRLSQSGLKGVVEVSCSSLQSHEIETQRVSVGSPSPEENPVGGRISVSDPHGDTAIELDGEGGTIIAREVQELSDLGDMHNIRPLSGALDSVAQLRGVRFWPNPKWVGFEHVSRIGMVAQEVAEVVPEVVQDNDGLRTMSYTGLVPLLLEAIKEQQGIIDAQSEALAAVEQRLDALEGDQAN